MNRLLKSRMVLEDVTYKAVAAEMGINRRVFQNKMNHAVVNGYTARFTDSQKTWLAARFNIDIDAIE